jgi:hypothetical protein
MTKKEILYRLRGYTDMMDTSKKISLFEYGIVRRPRDGRVVYYIPEINKWDWTIISLDKVKEALENINSGFYSFIGSDKETELKNLDNNYLSGIIFSINGWNGMFRDSCYFTSDNPIF